MVKKTSTYDESRHLDFGRRVMQDSVIKPNMQRMAINVLNYYPLYVLEKSGFALSEKEKLLVSRIPTVVVSCFLGVFIFLWTRKLYGSKSGLFALFLYAFAPNVLAHSRLATNDIHTAFFFFSATFFFVQYVKSPGWKFLIISAILSGLAQISKQTSLLILPLFPFLYLVHFITSKAGFGFSFAFLKSLFSWESVKELKKTAVHMVIFLVIMLFIINLGYGFKGFFSEKYMLPLPDAYIEAFLIGKSYNATGAGHGLIYLLGERNDLGFWYYYFVCMLFKLPLAIFAFALFSLFKCPRYFKENFIDEFTLCFVFLAVFVFFNFFCSAQIGIRYLLVAFPFLYVWLGKVIAFVPQKHGPAYRRILMLLSVWYMISSVSFFPHYLSYFNELIGNRLNMYKYLADSNVEWGQNGIYLNEYIENYRGKEQIHVQPWGKCTGIVLVDINNLVGIFRSNREQFKWLRENHEPVGHIGYSWLIYHIPSEGER